MSLPKWWREKSGRAKAVTVLATLLILQIGLCFGTQPIVESFRAVFHIKPSGVELEFLGYMMLEAMLCFVTLLALLIVPLFFRPQPDPQTLFESEGRKNEEDHD